MHRSRVARLLPAVVLLAGCAAAPAPQEALTWSDDWFSCDGRFQCIVVYDAYCNFTSVTAAHARKYEFWAQQEVKRLDEKVPCPPAADQPAPVPVCRRHKCDVL